MKNSGVSFFWVWSRDCEETLTGFYDHSCSPNLERVSVSKLNWSAACKCRVLNMWYKCECTRLHECFYTFQIRR